MNNEALSGAPAKTGTRSWLARAAVMVPVVGLAVAGIGLAMSSSNGQQSTATYGASSESTAPAAARTLAELKAGPCAAPEERPANPSPEWMVEMRAQTEAAVAEGQRTGFVPTRDRAQDGTYICGWGKAEHTMEDLKEMATNGGASAMYNSSTGGNIMGYTYPNIGFFTVEQTQAPGFDPNQSRRDRLGCDPATAKDCVAPGDVVMAKK